MIEIDMNMPENCADCCMNYDFMQCIVTGTNFWHNEFTFDMDKDRLPDCPIHGEREIIKPHPHYLCIKEMSNICGQCVMYFSCPYL